MIKKTAAAVLLFGLISPLPAHAEEHLFSDVGAKKRFALNVIGVGGAVTAIGAVFFFVGRSGAGLHVNPDGSLRPLGMFEEAQSATNLQRISLAVAGVGLATTVTGTVLLLLSRKKPAVTIAPVLSSSGGGLVLIGIFD
ncbi:MAG: hypothetical protein Q8S33_36530 [Myxococcales bacterium]|nr:hypothetical protein [Myxococcales bacterium]MDP3505907.1 hypothetical protein [Myxococcales bacterium]